MSPQLIFGLESNIALGFTNLIRTDVMGKSEMLFQIFIFFVINIFVKLAAKMASEMFSREVVVEVQVVEQELVAEITKWVRHDFTVFFISEVPFVEMVS